MIIISPSKTIGSVKLQSELTPSQPVFLNQSFEIVKELRKLNEKELTNLLDVNPKLGRLNYERYINWQIPFTTKNSGFTLASFRGDVYEGLNAEILNRSDLEFAQKQLRILSGLYGILRPFDLFQPYRLEMGTKHAIGKYKNLYDFWSGAITQQINNELKQNDSDLLINLASKEYYSALDFKNIRAQIITPEFRQFNNGNPKVVPILAKRARGLMTRFIIINQITSAENIRHFDYEGYCYSPELSSESTQVFIRHT